MRNCKGRAGKSTGKIKEIIKLELTTTNERLDKI